MMDFDCPLAFRHKKGEYFVGFCIKGEFYLFWLELVEFRLYLSASLCIYLFWLLMYWAIHFRGRYIYCFICFLFHMLGSKDLGTNVFRTLMCNVGKP